MTKIEYEFDEPDYILEFEYDHPFSQTISIIKEKEPEIVSFGKFLNSSKELLGFNGKTIMASKKLRTKCYFLTKDWTVYELRLK